LIDQEQLGEVLRDYSYAYFGGIGKALSKISGGIDKDLESACMKIHSEVYFSIVGVIALTSSIIPLTTLLLSIYNIIPLQTKFGINPLLLIPVTLGLPILIIFIAMLFPKMKASSRMSELAIEIPYASMYISVMVSGGLSPFESFLRMRKMSLLPKMKDEVNRIETIVMSTGVDPVTAMEKAAKTVELKDYNELLLGYASSVRTGGDTLHYLFNQTQNMFRKLTANVKAKGESAAMLMEAYTIIAILGVLGIFLVFVVGMSLPTAGASISPDQFFLFSFVVMPALSAVFLYAGDMVQFNYPISNWTPYYVFFGTIPIGLLLASQIVLPFFSDSFLIVPALMNSIIWIRETMNFAEGTEAAIGVIITLILVSIPGWISDYYNAGKDGKVQDGITQFLRDLVEVRKSGLSPEKSIEALAQRDYKSFSRYLKDISTKINWGYPLRQIYEEFSTKVSNWLALVNIYLLIDTMEVGGGTEQSIESLAEFSEASKQLEVEKKAVLMPLVIVPYIGAALLTGTTVMFLGFFTGSNLGVSVPQIMLYKTLLTPLAIHSFTLGLVTGKITSGRVSSGFKHALLLCLVALGGIWAVSNLNLGGSLI
jgi:flagellar protein FlaJ